LADKYRGVRLRVACLAVGWLLCALPARAEPEWQIRPYVGFTFGGSSTLVDLAGNAGKGRTKLLFGVNGGWLGEIVGVEGDLSYVPGYFDSGKQDLQLVVGSSVTTFTGNVVVGLPKSRTAYSLRPYAVGGFGVMHASAGFATGLPAVLTKPAVDVGGGATGFLTDRVGLNWELRYFRTVGGDEALQGDSFGTKRLSFWRVHMALVVKF